MTDPLAGLPGYALRRAANAMMAELGERLVGESLRVSDATVLILVGAKGRPTASRIGQTLDIRRANMVPLLDRLEAAGLIAREPIDRKSLAIVLTPAGETKLRRVRGIVAAFERELIERVPAEHRDHLLPALDALWRGAEGAQSAQ
ncbi:MAG: MarR family transcriptional regulator [Novosphingobium sp.]|nr:MarR family transcriptional regulator [Novosphingobium sp.]